MASNRHLGRIVALQSLYEYDFRESEELDIAELTARNLMQYDEAIDDKDFVYDITAQVLVRLEEIDEILAPAAPEWPITQIAKIDRSILRIAIYELVMKRDTPPKVVINEAVELAKSFGGDNASKFVNGVLGTVYREHIEESEPQEAQSSSEPGSKEQE